MVNFLQMSGKNSLSDNVENGQPHSNVNGETRHYYDDLGRHIGEQAGDLNRRYAYNGAGQLTASYDRLNNKTRRFSS